MLASVFGKIIQVKMVLWCGRCVALVSVLVRYVKEWKMLTFRRSVCSEIQGLPTTREGKRRAIGASDR